MPKSKKYRAAVIGGGAIAQECHLPGYRNDPRAELVAFVDPVKARHAEVQEKFGPVQAYTDYREMLRAEKPDVVSVCTPNALHAQMTVDALEAGAHVLCEKPLATTLKSADRMIAAARKARRKLMTGFTHRLYAGPQRCKALLDEKAIGKPFMIRVRNAHGGPYPGWAKGKWFYDPDMAAGGVLLDMGIHAIDLCHWLFGPVKSISAQTKTLVKRIPLDDNALMLLEFKNGAMGYIEAGWTSRPGFGGIEIYGTEGSIICDYWNGMKVCRGNASAGRDTVYEWEMVEPQPLQGGWPAEIPYWLDVLDGKRKHDMNGQAGRAALEVALAAYKSSTAGRRVELA